MSVKKIGPEGTGYLWSRVFNLIKLLTGDVAVTEKGNLQKQIDDVGVRVDDCFQSVSDGKRGVANAITDKGVTTAADATFATMEANIRAIKTNPKLQAKTAALSTEAQTVKPDAGYDGLSQVVVPAVKGTAAVGDVLAGKTFNSAAGIDQTGTLADKTGTADYSATASLDATNKRLKMKIPATGKFGTGNYLYAAYSTIASLIGLTAAKLVKDNTVLGIAGDSNNMNTAGCDATVAQILSGKKAGVKGAVVTGSMANKAATTVDAASVTQDDEYTYLGIPAEGFYDKNSKVRTQNSNLKPDYGFLDKKIICFKCYQIGDETNKLDDRIYLSADTENGTYFYDENNNVIYCAKNEAFIVKKGTHVTRYACGSSAHQAAIVLHVDINKFDIQNSICVVGYNPPNFIPACDGILIRIIGGTTNTVSIEDIEAGISHSFVTYSAIVAQKVENISLINLLAQ